MPLDLGPQVLVLFRNAFEGLLVSLLCVHPVFELPVLVPHELFQGRALLEKPVSLVLVLSELTLRLLLPLNQLGLLSLHVLLDLLLASPHHRDGVFARLEHLLVLLHHPLQFRDLLGRVCDGMSRSLVVLSEFL